MAKLVFCLLVLCVFVITSTASEGNSSGAPAPRSRVHTPRGRARVLPAEIPPSWLKERQTSRQQHPWPRTSIGSRDKKQGTVVENEAPPNSGKNLEEIAADLHVNRVEQVERKIALRKNVNNNDVSDELIEENAVDSETPKDGKHRNTDESLPVSKEIFPKANMVQHLQSERVLKGRSSPGMELNLSGIKLKKNDSVQLQDSNIKETSSENDSIEVSLESTDNAKSIEHTSYSSVSEESLEDKQVSSEENNNEAFADELNETYDSQNMEKTLESNSEEGEEEAGIDLKGVVNEHGIQKAQAERVDAVSITHHNIATKPLQVIATNINKEALKNTINNERRPKISAERHKSSSKSNAISEINQGPSRETENLKIQDANDEKMTETNIAEKTSISVNNNYFSEVPVQKPEKKKVEVEREQIQAENSELKARNIANITQPKAESIQATKLSDGKSTQKVGKGTQTSTKFEASKLTSDHQTKSRTPLAIFPKIPYEPDKAETSEARPSAITEQDALSPAANPSSSDKNYPQTGQSVHPKLKGEDTDHDHEQQPKSSEVSEDLESETRENKITRLLRVHPKLKRQPSSGSTETGPMRTHAAVTHPKLKSKSDNSGTRETGNKLPSQQGNEEIKNRKVVHPKLVDSSKQTENPAEEVHTVSPKIDPLSQQGNKKIKSDEIVHPKLVGSSKQTQHAAGDVQVSSTVKNTQESNDVFAKIGMEQLRNDISDKIAKVSKTILDESSNSLKTSKDQTQIKIENISEKLTDQKPLVITPAQARRVKSKQMSTMVTTISLAIIVLVSIITIIGAVFKKLSFTRQRYGEHMPLNTEEEDDLPLYSRYQSPYESWKELQ